MIKLIATDIDGTILKHDFVFNKEVKDCINNLSANGIKVVLVTGRMHAATIHVAKELGLETPIVSYQGGLVKQGNETLYKRELDVSCAQKIIDWAKENKIHTNLYMNDELYVENDCKTVQMYVSQGISNFHIKPLDSLKLGSINKMVLIDYEDAKRVSAWEKHLQTTFPNLSIIKSTPYYCEVCNREATKFHGVDFLRQHWGFEREEVMTIGDQNNDLDLLKAGGIKVAMGNATEELKAVANHITDTVENNGFVKAVERFVYDKISN